ncbi:maleylpyruvate isomerase family mycothiol-dependent enzyme [Nocardiopsis salina]|uniref:maleylpyruvate isomerase family mycothiol-dependent enzyme n=1 Tax=Nocardiopsis salina TaxID=245836 RepID=UPI00034608C6|nr:maleylpyruvate isomerase family mycothiol-dependent enzyme [Nocardiopsis salina]
MTPVEIPPTPENLRLLDEATERLLASCRRLSDSDTARPSTLPGWTRGHVLNHLARQGPALERLLTWAATGVETPQYSSRRARDTEIEEGAHRSAADLVADLTETADSLRKALTDLPGSAWDTRIRPVTGELCTPRRVLVIRLREIEVHHTDLAAGYTFGDIPDAGVQVVLADVSAHLSGSGDAPSVEVRSPDGAQLAAFGTAGPDRPVITGSAADTLGWLTGRTRGEGLRAPQGLPALPGWI